ncbi:MAG: hypothetical protein RSC30_00005 [Oscillospiraceae bacterium]
MRILLFLVRRHCVLFLRNKLNILLSFASIIIILGIYIMFLRDFMIDMVAQHGVLPSHVDAFTDRFMTAGLLVVIGTTTCFGVVQIAVNDAAVGIKRDYLVAPATTFQITIGYLIASTLISSFFTCLSVVGCMTFFDWNYGSVPSINEILKICGTSMYSCCMNSMILLCLTRPLKSTATFSTLANLYGTVIGFLAGAYLPCYFYPSWLRDILFYFPPAQMASVLRQMFTRDMSLEFETESLLRAFGICLERSGEIVSLTEQWRILVLSGLILLAILCILNLENKFNLKRIRGIKFIHIKGRGVEK